MGGAAEALTNPLPSFSSPYSPALLLHQIQLEIKGSAVSYPAGLDAARCQMDFYRAMRMHSADYAVARCLPVRPSVTRRYLV